MRLLLVLRVSLAGKKTDESLTAWLKHAMCFDGIGVS
jgi:hypothetical protein